MKKDGHLEPSQTVDKVSFHFVYSHLKVCSHEKGVCPAWLENACHVEGSLSARRPQCLNFRKGRVNTANRTLRRSIDCMTCIVQARAKSSVDPNRTIGS